LDWTDMDVVELFSGTAAITRACWAAGLKAHGFDIEDRSRNVTSYASAHTHTPRHTAASYCAPLSCPE
jgi:site-specific DNA-cytosine methylase